MLSQSLHSNNEKGVEKNFSTPIDQNLRLFCFETVLFVELLDTSASLVSLLLSSIEWMALRANFDVDVLLGRTGSKCVATVTCNGCLIVIRMDSLTHDFHLSNQKINSYYVLYIPKQLFNYSIERGFVQYLFQIISDFQK